MLNQIHIDLKNIYEEITVNEEESHDYLGMILTHDRENQVIDVDMRKYIMSCVEEFHKDEPDERICLVITPATNFLFRTRNAQKLSKKRASLFHSIVAKFLFVAKRSRPDILLTISFLTTQVKDPDTDDWGK